MLREMKIFRPNLREVSEHQKGVSEHQKRVCGEEKGVCEDPCPNNIKRGPVRTTFSGHKFFPSRMTWSSFFLVLCRGLLPLMSWYTGYCSD